MWPSTLFMLHNSLYLLLEIQRFIFSFKQKMIYSVNLTKLNFFMILNKNSISLKKLTYIKQEGQVPFIYNALM